MKHREIIKLLEADGWFHVRTSGGHAIYKHNEKPGIVGGFLSIPGIWEKE